MPAAVATILEQAVRDRLNEPGLSQEFDATSKLLRAYKPENLQTLRVEVVATTVTFERLSRTLKQQLTTIEIGVLKYVGFVDDEPDDAAKQDLSLLVEEIADRLADPLEGFEHAGPVELPGIPELYLPDLWVQGIFGSVVLVQYRTQKAV